MAYKEYVKVGSAAAFRKSINDGLNEVQNSATQCINQFTEMKNYMNTLQKQFDNAMSDFTINMNQRFDTIMNQFDKDMNKHFDEQMQKYADDMNKRLDDIEEKVDEVVSDVFTDHIQELVHEAYHNELEDIIADGYEGASYQEIYKNVVISPTEPEPMNEKYPIEKPVLWFQNL